MKKIPFLNNLKILSDENIPIKITELLRTEGYNIKKSPLGITDKQLSKLAKEESRIILTLDKDFLNKDKFPPKDFNGIIFINIQPPIIDTVFSSLKKLFTKVSSSEFKGKLVIASRFGYKFKP